MYSLDIGLLMWCGEGWFGRACERKCSQQDDNFHTCQPDGTVISVTECTYTGLICFLVQLFMVCDVFTWLLLEEKSRF
ncbi:hypothetical protein DPMN_108844 [Dreissena polymorpha]|uniref:Uncharacterized protein n=1 Tax=Dreissena polymorpha TaxID=45954 RepID=A0A9D4K981_DREPO|nr:hypothetical protein DPMN_108844 [Dreissena polymorpha]